jgi:hypothetical protein
MDNGNSVSDAENARLEILRLAVELVLDKGYEIDEVLPLAEDFLDFVNDEDHTPEDDFKSLLNQYYGDDSAITPAASQTPQY